MNKYWTGILLLISMPAWAISPHAATPAEQAMCEARGMPGGQGRYQGHFCDGLRFLDRAYASIGNRQEMQHYLNESISNFNYVLTHTQEEDVMRGEVHVGKARALKLAGKKGEAAGQYIQALRYTPNSPAIYLALADFYQEAGNKPKALEMVTEGLRRNPDSKGLKRRYTELGGKPPYPETVTKAMPADMAGAVVKPESEAATPSGDTTSQDADDTKLKAPAGSTPQIESPKIGSPNNPHCRFCTD